MAAAESNPPRTYYICVLSTGGATTYSKVVASSLSCCKRTFQKVYLYQSHKIWGLLDKYTTTTIIVYFFMSLQLKCGRLTTYV